MAFPAVTGDAERETELAQERTVGPRTLGEK